MAVSAINVILGFLFLFIIGMAILALICLYCHCAYTLFKCDGKCSEWKAKETRIQATKIQSKVGTPSTALTPID